MTHGGKTTGAAGAPQITILRGGSVYSPTPIGRADVTIGGETILEVAPSSSFGGVDGANQIDVTGLLVVPGLIDAHVHVQGGGATSGPETRPPEMPISSLTASGVTTAVTCMGGDIVSRSLRTALMRALAIEREGLSAYLYTGGFGSPLPTLTESLHSDLALIDRVLGVKMAIAETWCGHLTDNEFARLVGDAYLGARLAGKAGVIHIHIGEGPEGLSWLQKQIPRIGIPWRHIQATHVNRTAKMLGEAVDFALQGGHVDITALQSPAHGREHAVPPAEAVVRLLAAKVPLGHISMTSDSGASRITVDANGGEKHVVRTPECLLDELRALVVTHHMPIETALVPFTANPADQLGLRTKGRIARGMSADIAVLDPGITLRHLVGRGKMFIRDRAHLQTGHFEPLSWPQPLTRAT